MSCDNTKRLAPLKIIAFKQEDRGAGSPDYTKIDEFEVQFDPDSYSKKMVNVFQDASNIGINISLPASKYSYSPASELTFQLIFDASEEDEDLLDILPVPPIGGLVKIDEGSSGVSKQINKFLEVCYDYDGDIHQPRFLNLNWGGDLNFPCRLKSVDIQYTMFSREGVAIRAKLDTVFLSDTDEEIRMKKEGKQSPDISKKHTVKDGETLPLICRKSYGTSGYYLLLAKHNNLNHFMRLKIGQELEIPTLKNLLKN